jgi:ribosome-binding protein aMBF1 (putative translation factor)
MATIFESISLSDCQHPVYTSYELSKEVKEKRHKDGLSIEEFSIKYDVDSGLVNQIETTNQVFSPKLLKVCAKILSLPIKEITRTIEDDVCAISYRSSDDSDGVKRTVNIANKIFNEIIMQKKISAS